MSHELKTGGDRGYLRIATEEAFATREQVDAYLRMVKNGTADRGLVSLWGFYGQSTSARATQVLEGLLDLGEQRIRNMDATGIDKAILALTAPGAQPILDVAEAKGIAQRANDLLAETRRAVSGSLHRHDDRRPAGPRMVGERDRARRADAWALKAYRSTAIRRASTSTNQNSIRFSARSPTPASRCTSIRPSPPDAMIGPMLEAGLDGAIFGFGVDTGHAFVAPDHDRHL